MSPVFGAREFDQVRRAAADAVVWGLPLILTDLVARTHPLNGRFFELPAAAEGMPPGLLATHGDMWSASAVLDVAGGPAVITLPNAHGAYLSLILHDDWGRVLAVLGPHHGQRAIAVVGPGWKGAIHRNVTEVRAPGDRVWAVCHILSAGEGGREDAHRLREGLALRSHDGLSTADKAEPIEPAGQRSFDDVLQMMAPATFFCRLARLAPPHIGHADDPALLRTLYRVGVVAGQPFNCRDWPAEHVRAMDEGFEEGLRRVRWAAPQVGGEARGWARAATGVRRRADYLERAAAALQGLGAAPADEVLVFTTRSDGAGLPLSGERDYALTFGPDDLPPATAFWSICVIDQNGAPLDAPFARLSFGDWFGLTPADGEGVELAILLGGDLRSGSLLRPPPGPFGLRLEVYRPAGNGLGQAWTPPKVLNRGPCSVRGNISFAAARFAAAAAAPPRALTEGAVLPLR